MEGSVGMENGERERGCEEVGGAVATTVETEGVGTDEGGDVVVSLFNDSAEEFFSAMETISSLCRLPDKDGEFDQGEVQRLSSMITFLKEWRYFCYEPKAFNFTYETKSPQVKEDIKGVNLPQFSSASVPEREQSCGVSRSPNLNSKDFVLHAGGSVWALDWCPRMHEVLDYPIKCEYLAVAAHPPDSSYHRIGAPLTGRGIVQIWCLINMNGKDESYSKWPGGRPRKRPGCRRSPGGSNMESKIFPSKPRGRPRKRSLIAEPLEDENGVWNSPPQKKRGRPRKLPVASEPLNVINDIPPPKRPRGRPRKIPDKKENIADMDVRQELSMPKFIPALVADDAHVKNKSSPRHPRGRARKTLEEPEKVDALHAAKGLCNSEIIPYAALDDSNVGTTHKHRGRPRKKPDTMENVDAKAAEDPSIVGFTHSHAVENFTLQTKSSPARRPRGRPRKKPDKITSIDDQHIVQGLSVAEFAPAQSINDPNITSVDDPHELQDISITAFVPAQSINDSDMGSNSSLPTRRRGRPKKGSDKTLSDINGQKPKSPVQKGSVRDVSDIVVADIVKQGELRKDAYALPRTDGTVNTSTDVLQGCNIEERITTADSTNLCAQRSSVLRSVNDGTSVHPILPTRDMESVDSHVQDALDSSHDVAQKRSLDDNNVSLSLQKGIPLPRVVLCLGHNGKVAWDVKWRPHRIGDVNFEHRMGYLAVLLGNGCLEVWEVPCPRIVKNLYKSSFKEGADPRFLKLRPVFRCSKLKFADRQSIPLTMEWSRSAPSDLILVGCHDGTVALWKFSAEGSTQDVRPLLCFTADNVPIRAVAWAPGESDSESANLIVTAGHEGLRFWDIRDPYRPLWDFNPVQRIILSLDWLQHPSCLIFSLDDGTMKTLSLSKAACDVPVTGKPFDGSRHGVMHNYYRSHFAIWSVQVSPITGVAAYCCADGSTFCFQITAKSLDKARFKSPHLICGTLMEMDDSLAIGTPTPCTFVADLPRPVRGLPSHFNSASEDPQAHGDDPAENLGYRVSEPSAGRKLASRTSKLEKLFNENQSVEPLNLVEEEKQEDVKKEVMNARPSSQNFLVLPPKVVAVHRVRWNINRGSERWLCYGGAAGIVRCQDIASLF